MAANDITVPSANATLTQKELFQRFLDAPFYKGGGMSTLVDTRRVSEGAFGDRFGGFYSGLWPDQDLHEFLLDELRDSDNPECDLDEIVNDIAGMLRDFEELKCGFYAVCAATRVDDLDEDGTAEEVREWEENPRYALPMHVAGKVAE